MGYAEGTTVAPERSRAEIEATLRRYGASGFLYGYDGDLAVIGFAADGRQVRFTIAMPTEDEVRYTATGRTRSAAQVKEALLAEERRRWRALALAIKAKLEVVQSGIATFEEEFLAHVVLPGGELVGAWLRPQLEATYASGQMPRMLPALEAGT